MELHTCCINGDLSHFERLMTQNLDLNEKDDQGYTPLHHALMNGHFDVARLLVKSGANVMEKDKYGRTSLYLSAKRNNRQFVEELLHNINFSDSNNIIETVCQLNF